MPELVPANTAAPAIQRRPRLPEAAPRRRAPARGGLDAQLAARAPGPQPRAAGAGVAGRAIFKGGDARLDGAPAAVVSAELAATITHYEDGIARLKEGATSCMSHVRDYGFDGQIADALTSGRAPSVAPWLAILKRYDRAAGLLRAARVLGERPEGLKSQARLVADAIREVQATHAAAMTLASEQQDFLGRSAETARGIAKGIEFGRDLAIAFVIAQGAVVFAPGLATGGAVGAEAAAVAPSTIGGTLAGAGKVALLGGAVRGSVLAAGTALGGGDLDQVGGAAADGMRDGAVDGVMGANGRAANGLLGSGREVEVAAATGTYGAATKASLAGTSGRGLVDAAAGGGTKSVLRATLEESLRPQ